MFSTLKGYLVAAAGVVVALFLAVLSYRGKKIEVLKSENKTLKENSDKLESTIHAQKKELETREKIQDILAEPDSTFSGMHERMRQRRSNRDNREK